jgi:hypothetical protein
MKKFIINERQEKLLIEMMINEDTQLTIVKYLKNYLDKYYTKGSQTEITPDGKFSSKKIIGVKTKGSEGADEVVTNITPTDLFHRLEEQIKDKIDKGEKRNVFIKQVIIDWYNSKITPEGTLSKNITI